MTKQAQQNGNAAFASASGFLCDWTADLIERQRLVCVFLIVCSDLGQTGKHSALFLLSLRGHEVCCRCQSGGYVSGCDFHREKENEGGEKREREAKHSFSA